MHIECRFHLAYFGLRPCRAGNIGSELSPVINQKTWVILDAHTYVFEDGSRTHGKPYALEEESGSTNYAFHGNALLLINDLKIIGSNIKTLERKRSLVCVRL